MLWKIIDLVETVETFLSWSWRFILIQTKVWYFLGFNLLERLSRSLSFPLLSFFIFDLRNSSTACLQVLIFFYALFNIWKILNGNILMNLKVITSTFLLSGIEFFHMKGNENTENFACLNITLVYDLRRSDMIEIMKPYWFMVSLSAR